MQWKSMMDSALAASKSRFYGSVHHQLAACIAEGCFELAGIKTWFAEISTVQHDMVFTWVVWAIFCVHLLAFGIKNTQGYFSKSRKTEPQERHFDERIGRILEEFDGPFCLWLVGADLKIWNCHGDYYWPTRLVFSKCAGRGGQRNFCKSDIGWFD